MNSQSNLLRLIGALGDDRGREPDKPHKTARTGSGQVVTRLRARHGNNCMIIQSIGELNASAYHEAGHVVIAHALNLGVLYARVVWDEERKRWGGCMKAAPRLDDSELEAQVPVIAASKAKESVAGMLAQAKFMAEQHVGTDLLRFNPGMSDFGDLWPLLRGRERTEESPGSIHLEFVGPDRGIRSLEFQASVCLISNEDIINLNTWLSGQWGMRPAESLEELVVETMRLLDDEARWNDVRIMAAALIEAQGRYLEGEELMRLLAKP